MLSLAFVCLFVYLKKHINKSDLANILQDVDINVKTL